MAEEIEYKFLVDRVKWDKATKPTPERIVQGFLHNTEDLVIRIRIKGDKGFLTLKGKTEGISRKEFEYEIPVTDAEEIMHSFTDKYITKQRYAIEFKGHNWEVDVFEGKLNGLVLAELEVNSESQEFERPEWVTEDVSRDPQYYNAVLINKC